MTQLGQTDVQQQTLEELSGHCLLTTASWDSSGLVAEAHGKVGDESRALRLTGTGAEAVGALTMGTLHLGNWASQWQC